MKKRLLLLSLMVVMGNLSMGENFKEGTYLGNANKILFKWIPLSINISN